MQHKSEVNEKENLIFKVKEKICVKTVISPFYTKNIICGGNVFKRERKNIIFVHYCGPMSQKKKQKKFERNQNRKNVKKKNYFV